jgi:hypothetical protein
MISNEIPGTTGYTDMADPEPGKLKFAVPDTTKTELGV